MSLLVQVFSFLPPFLKKDVRIFHVLLDCWSRTILRILSGLHVTASALAGTLDMPGFGELLKSLLVRPSGRLMPSPWDDPEFSSCAQSSEDELRPDYLFFSSYWLAFFTNRSAIHIVHLDAFFFSFF